MKRVLFASLLIVLATLSACGLQVNNESQEGDTPINLSEFQPLLSAIDMSRENQYQEAFLYGDWITSKIMREVYVDGVLKERFDVTESSLPVHIILRGDHTVGADGIWIYAYNYLLIKDGSGGYGSFEVANAESGLLWLKTDKIYAAAGGTATDGTRQYNVYELTPQNK